MNKNRQSWEKFQKSIFAEYLINPFDDKYYIRDYCNKYIATYNFNKTVLFSL